MTTFYKRPDYTGNKLAAQMLVQRIKRYWRSSTFPVKVWIEEDRVGGEIVYSVRTDMCAGLPRGKWTEIAKRKEALKGQERTHHPAPVPVSVPVPAPTEAA